ncbi:hypothetical protein [Burkholderia sp. ABCPW 11]|uniref:hypothetical protein n=1 Tax=Burkholderia sp. ABCPW 11 TaxID=1637859 RepID=UPI000B04C27E|nr:hypothetical protein [Burkholderia sp. ABCPW 11]
MPDYILLARVVLHKDDARTQEHSPDADEYETLHTEMHARGFRRYAVDDDDKLMYKLPPGEYHIELTAETGSEARNEALSRAKAAATAATSARRNSVITSGGGGISWCRLKKISEDPDAE